MNHSLSRKRLRIALAIALAVSTTVTVLAVADPLAFDANRFTVGTVQVGDRTVAYRAYEGLVYVANPVDAEYQRLNFYVPAEYYEGKSINGYTAETAPIFLPNSVGGYMPGPAAKIGVPGMPAGVRPPAGGPLPEGAGMLPPPPAGGGFAKTADTLAAALAHGYVVAAPGARGRTLKDSAGTFTGKAPACIVDLKAAVRYLRHNDQAMPGDAEKIVSNGTSAGGALSALLGATGDAADYEPYLKAVGAAPARDAIFAASCYCPITNLDHADAAYEWLFNGLDDYDQRGRTGTMTAAQIDVSAQLKPLFPPYLNSLGLKSPAGATLALDPAGKGTFRDYVKSFVVASAQRALAGGTDISALPWITIKDGGVTDLDFTRFVAYAKRMKTAPAFDALDLRSPENNLFGTATIDSRHFTAFAQEHSTERTLAEVALVRMMNPLGYIGAEGVATARHWRIRHGAIDRDTSLAIPVILATALQNHGATVDLAFPWGRGHSGDYDLDELFAWIDSICR